MFQVGIITLSDKGYKGEREDISGPTIERIIKENGYETAYYTVLPDEPEMLKKELIHLCDDEKLNLILTTGGTGFSVRDCTPEATLAVGERQVPGIAEAIRAYSMTITKRAMLSRGVAVIRGKTLIINLPGSPKAVEEALSYIITELSHGLKILQGTESECAR
jgi:molybdopterin adenylyltransferase